MVNHPWAGSGAGARNWELFSGAAELEEQLGKVSERMQEMGFSEQRIKVGYVVFSVRLGVWMAQVCVLAQLREQPEQPRATAVVDRLSNLGRPAAPPCPVMFLCPPFAPHQDVAELARLKILGSKLKKSATRKEPPSVVLQAMQQQRQVAEGGGGTTGGGATAAGSLAAGLELPAAGSGVPGGLISPSTAGEEGGLGVAAALLAGCLRDIASLLGCVGPTD
jgi:hypothetical protein